MPVLAQERAREEALQAHQQSEDRAWAAIRKIGFEKVAQQRLHIDVHEDKRPFGRYKRREVHTPLGLAVFLGDLPWEVHTWIARDGDVRRREERLTGLTANREVVLMNSAMNGSNVPIFLGRWQIRAALWAVLAKHGVFEE